MSTRQKTFQRSGRSVNRAIRFLLAAVGIVAASVSAVFWLIDSSRMERPGASTARRTSSKAAEVAPRSPKARPAGANVPLYSEDWTEDSGQGLAARYSQPITDPQSLEQVRTADEGRSQRGIASLLSELKCGRSPDAGRPGPGAPARGLSRAPPHVDRRVRQGRSMAERGTSGRSRLPPARACEHGGPSRGRGPEARRDGKLRRLLQRFELHIPTRSRRIPPESFRLARGDPALQHLPRAEARGPGRPVALERGIHDSG